MCFLKTLWLGPARSWLRSRVPVADGEPAPDPLGSARAGDLGDTDPVRGVGDHTPGRLRSRDGAATQGPGLPAGPLGSLVVHELSRVDAILLVQLLVLPGCHTGLLG